MQRSYLKQKFSTKISKTLELILKENDLIWKIGVVKSLKVKKNKKQLKIKKNCTYLVLT